MSLIPPLQSARRLRPADSNGCSGRRTTELAVDKSIAKKK